MSRTPGVSDVPLTITTQWFVPWIHIPDISGLHPTVDECYRVMISPQNVGSEDTQLYLFISMSFH